MNPFRPTTATLPTDHDKSYTITTPIRGHPMYKSYKAPPGLFLHPRSNIYVPACQHCLLQVNRYSPKRRVVCRCPDSVQRRAVMPVCMPWDFYPLTYEVSVDRERHHNTIEPLLGDESDINVWCNKASKHFTMDKPEVEQLSAKIKQFIYDALRDRPHKGQFEAKEMSFLSQVITGLLEDGNTYIHKMQAPEAIKAVSRSFLSFAGATETLVSYSCKNLLPETDILNRDLKILVRTAKMLEDKFAQAEMATATLQRCIPTEWKQHKLLGGKQWFAHPVNNDTNNWRQHLVTRFLSNAVLPAEPSMAHFKKLETTALHLLLCALRTAARSARTFFEFNAYEEADRFWEDPKTQKYLRRSIQDDPLTGPPLYPSASIAADLMTLRQPIPNQEAQDPVQQPDLPTPGPPPANLFPELPRRTTTFQDPGRSTVRRARSARSGGGRISLSSFIPTMGILLMLLAACAAAPTADPQEEVLYHNPGHFTSPSKTINGMFAKDNFIYTHKGQRLINANTKTVIRDIDTDSLTTLPFVLTSLEKSLDRLCGVAAGRKILGQFVTFYRMPHSRLATLEEMCLDSKGEIGKVTSYHTQQRLTFFLQNEQQLDVARAPIQFDAMTTSLYYTDGDLVDLSFFPGGVNATFNISSLALHDQFTFFYQYVSPNNLTLLAIDCDNSTSTFCHNSEIMLPCMSHQEEPSFFETCDSTPSRMRLHTNEITKLISSLFPLLPPEGKQSKEDIRLISTIHEYKTSRKTGEANMQHEFAALRHIQMQQMHKRSIIQPSSSSPHHPHPITKHDAQITRFKRAIGLILAGVTLTGVVASQLVGTAVSINQAGSISHIKNAINAANAGIARNTATTRRQEEQIKAISTFITDLYTQQVMHHDKQWFQMRAMEIESKFRDLLNTAHSSINRIGIIRLAKGRHEVLPSMLSQEDLDKIAQRTYKEHFVTLTNNLAEVEFSLLANGTNLIAFFNIPIVEPERMFNIFQITAIPAFSATGKQVLPERAATQVAIQKTGNGFLPLTTSEMHKCTTSFHACTASSSVLPAIDAPCGVAPFFNGPTEICNYVETFSTNPFFHTLGNFTCFSVFQPTVISATCVNIKKNKHGLPWPEGKLDIKGAGCFTFSAACKLESSTGQTILPNNNIGSPFTLPALPLPTSQSTRFPSFITPDIPKSSRVAALSEIETILQDDIAPEAPSLIDFKHTQSFTWSTLFIIPIIIIIIVILVFICNRSHANTSALSAQWESFEAEMKKQQKVLRDRMRRAGALITPSLRSLASAVSRHANPFDPANRVPEEEMAMQPFPQSNRDLGRSVVSLPSQLSVRTVYT